MSSSDSKTLVMRAQQAITEAAKQYGKSKSLSEKHIQVRCFSWRRKRRCSDFMSPMDCNIMFNVCDPVMCPASRCDLGGNYRLIMLFKQEFLEVWYYAFLMQGKNHDAYLFVRCACRT